MCILTGSMKRRIITVSPLKSIPFASRDTFVKDEARPAYSRGGSLQLLAKVRCRKTQNAERQGKEKTSYIATRGGGACISYF